MWSRPRETIQRIVADNPARGIEGLAAMSGIALSLDRASKGYRGDETPWGFVVFSSVTFGAIGGIFNLYITAALVRWTGKWMGGKASSEHIRAALAWSDVPYACILALLILQMALLGEEMFVSATPRLDDSFALQAALIVIGLAAVVVWIWHFVIMMKALAQVQGFSAWTALGNWLIALGVVFGPILLVIILTTKPDQLTR
jgi:hypothetical protein